MVAANPDVPVFGEGPSAADEAFAKMMAANPGVRVLDGPSSHDEDTETYAGVRVLGAGNAPGRSSGGGMGGWKFSSSLSAEKLEQLQGLIAINSLDASEVRENDAATRIAADEAFQKMVGEHAGAKEVSPGVFVVDSP